VAACGNIGGYARRAGPLSYGVRNVLFTAPSPVRCDLKPEILPMILKINLAVCVVFVLAAIGILLTWSDSATLSQIDLRGLLIFSSPTLLWAVGAWVGRRSPWSSIVCLVASILLMSVELYALYLDAEAARKEAITKQYTQHMAGFLAMLLQWAVGLPLITILAAIWLFDEGDL
jgi:hypothetical protein